MFVDFYSILDNKGAIKFWLGGQTIGIDKLFKIKSKNIIHNY